MTGECEDCGGPVGAESVPCGDFTLCRECVAEATCARMNHEQPCTCADCRRAVLLGTWMPAEQQEMWRRRVADALTAQMVGFLGGGG